MNAAAAMSRRAVATNAVNVAGAVIAASAEAKVADVTHATKVKADQRRGRCSSQHRKPSSQRLSRSSNNRPNPLSKPRRRTPRRNAKAKGVAAAAEGAEVVIALNAASAQSARHRQRQLVRKVRQQRKFLQWLQAVPQGVMKSLDQLQSPPRSPQTQWH